MHIPDGFLSHGVAMTTAGVAAGVAGYSVKRSLAMVNRDNAFLLGAAAALVFAGQMVNFPVARGTSGHFLGGVFLAILFGPSLATVLIAILLAVQMLLFQDGGLLALGANIFNMGGVATFIGYGAYCLVAGLVGGRNGVLVGAFVAGWFGVVLSAIACALELGISGLFPTLSLVGSMLSVHIKIGVAEGLITLVLAALLLHLQGTGAQGGQGDCPVLLPEGEGMRNSWRLFLLLALLVGVAGSPFAARSPDGLERVALDYGFSDRQEETVVFAPLGDYRLPGIANEHVATALAGLLGVGTLFGVVAGVGRLLVNNESRPTSGR